MSLSLILPLNFGLSGFESFEDSETVAAVKQNFRALLLTSPGEYVMDASFGVGLRNYLFEPGGLDIPRAIKLNIENQASTYMPYIQINNIDVDLENIDSNVLSIAIEYNITESVLNQVLQLTVSI